MNEVCILDAAAVNARLLRLAYEILEQHTHMKQLVVIGIDERGYLLASHLVRLLTSISPLSIQLYSIIKIKNQADYKNISVEYIENQVVLLVDDVLYTGRTLLRALTLVMPNRPAAVRSLVLIDRGHRKWPVDADYVGLDLATTLQEFVSVRYDSTTQSFAAYLS